VLSELFLPRDDEPDGEQQNIVFLSSSVLEITLLGRVFVRMKLCPRLNGAILKIRSCERSSTTSRACANNQSHGLAVVLLGTDLIKITCWLRPCARAWVKTDTAAFKPAAPAPPRSIVWQIHVLP
jgi:hypothetical protein